MSFAIFNEEIYLANYPDVQAAVKAGSFKSGLEHFQQFGIKEGRVLVSPFYKETYYLQNNPDIAAAVQNGGFSSGLHHYIASGETEGRQTNGLFDEEFYLEKNPDVTAAVKNGTFHSGWQHYIIHGEAEGREASVLFEEEFYLRKNPDVAAAVKAGTLTSGLEHYLLYGQAEGRSGTTFNELGYTIGEESSLLNLDITQIPAGLIINLGNRDVGAAVKASSLASAFEHYIKYGQFEGRGGIFTGTSGNDTVTGFGQIDTLYGVDRSPGPCVFGGTPTGGQCLDFYSQGINEADVLVGGSGKDTFVLGRYPREGKVPPAICFYIGKGNADFATIKNFEIGKDTLVLAGSKDNYLFAKSDGDLNIFLSATGNGETSLITPDLVAVVEGVTSVSQIESSIQFTTGYISSYGIMG